MPSLPFRTRLPALLVIILALLGAVNASYVSYLFYFVLSANGGLLFCDLNNIFSCSQALLLDNAKFFGIPACTIALVVYPIILAFAWRAYRRPAPDTYLPTAVLGGLGTLMNAYILYQESIANVYCLLCIACGVIILSILILSLYGRSVSRW